MRVDAGAIGLTTVLLLVTGAAAASPQEGLLNAEFVSFEQHGLAAAAERTRDFDEPIWVVYRTPGSRHHHSHCCHQGHGRGGRTDDDLEYGYQANGESTALLVLVRFDSGHPSRLRLVDPACPVGFSGRSLLWADDIPVDESLAQLEVWLDAADEDLAGELLMAMAFHRGEAAGALLERLSQYAAEPEVRKQAIFWLSQTSGDHAEAIYRAALEDSDSEVAKHAVFALSQVPEPASLEYLTRLMEQRRRPELRGEALFWIGQSDSDDALAVVSRILNE